MDNHDHNTAAGTAYEPFRHHDDTEFLVPPATVKTFRKDKSSRPLLILKTMAVAVSLAIIGVQVALLLTYRKFKDTRMLWQHGLGLKAWPEADLGSISTPVILGVAGFTVLLNLSGLLLSIRKRNRITSGGVDMFEILLHLAVVGAWTAAVLVDYLLKSGLRSWSCLNKAYAAQMANNSAGLEEVCAESVGTLAAGILVMLLEVAIVVTKWISRIRSGERGRKGMRSVGSGYDKIKEPADILEMPMLGAEFKPEH